MSSFPWSPLSNLFIATFNHHHLTYKVSVAPPVCYPAIVQWLYSSSSSNPILKSQKRLGNKFPATRLCAHFAGAWEALTTTVISIIFSVLRQEKLLNSFLLNYHTIQLSRKNATTKKEKDNKRAPTVCVCTIKKRIELKFGSFSPPRDSGSSWSWSWIDVYWFRK